VSSVLSRRPHKLCETVVQVSALQPQPPPALILDEPIDEERLLVKKLPFHFSFDELETFLSRASTVRMLRGRIGLKPTTALLDFDTAPGIHQNYIFTVICDSVQLCDVAVTCAKVSQIITKKVITSEYLNLNCHLITYN